MTSGYKISIIVPVYNTAAYLETCLDSLLAMDSCSHDIEIILVDDGSKDNSGEICDRYAGKHKCIKAFHNINKGVSAARNFGIEHATGDYLLFVDSDDAVAADYLTGFKFGLDFSLQGFRRIRDGGEISLVKYGIQQFEGEVGCGCIALHMHTGPYCKLFRSNIVKEFNIRFPENISYGEDTIFVYNYLLHCKTGYVSDKCGYLYKDMIIGSLSHKKYSKEERLYFYTRKFDLIDQLYASKSKASYRAVHGDAIDFLREICMIHNIKDSEFRNNKTMRRVAKRYLRWYEYCVCLVSVNSLCSLYRSYFRFRAKISS